MSERRRKTGVTNKMVAYTAAILVHAGIIGAMLYNFTSEPKKVVEAFDAEKIDVINATTIEESQIKDQQDLLKKKEAEKKRREEQEKKRLEDLRQQAKDEKKKLDDLKEKQKQEQAKTKELEAERKKIALKKKQEDEKRAKELAERKKKEKAEQKKKADEQKRQEKIALERKAAEDKKKAEDEAAKKRLDDLLAEEEQRVIDQRNANIRKERSATAISKYLGLISNKIGRFRTVDPSFETWRESVVVIKVSSSGDVQSVRTIESSGDARYDSSVERAIYKASPLPIPDLATEPDAHNALLEFEFEVKHPGGN